MSRAAERAKPSKHSLAKPAAGIAGILKGRSPLSGVWGEAPILCLRGRSPRVMAKPSMQGKQFLGEAEWGLGRSPNGVKGRSPLLLGGEAAVSPKAM